MKSNPEIATSIENHFRQIVLFYISTWWDSHDPEFFSRRRWRPVWPCSCRSSRNPMSQTRPTQCKSQQHGLNMKKYYSKIFHIFHRRIIFQNITVRGCRVGVLVCGEEGGDPARVVGTDVWLGQVLHHLLLSHLHTTQYSSVSRLGYFYKPSGHRWTDAPLHLVNV